jgi:hypothetical protein
MMMHLSQKNKERAKKEHNVIYSNTNNTWSKQKEKKKRGKGVGENLLHSNLVGY